MHLAPPCRNDDVRVGSGKEHRTCHRLVPEMVAFCDDASVIGAEFYVMRRVEGIVPRASLGAALDRDGARRLSRNAVDTLSRSTGSMAWLAARTPEDAGACVIHGDFRLDNLVLDAEDPTRAISSGGAGG